MELRTYLEILHRRRRLLVAATMIVALVAGITSALRTPMYRADALVLLRPNDPSEQLDGTQTNTPVANADRYLSAQLNIIKSESVARAAAKEVSGASVALLAQVSAGQSGATDIVRISATDSDPARATKVANAFAKAYIENRRQIAVEGLERAAKELDAKLRELQARIGELDARIAAEDPQDKALATPVLAAPPKPRSSTAPAPSVTQPTEGPTADLGPLTSDEALKAARYAAAVQYETLYARQQELLVDKSLKRGEAELISEAKTPGSPASPRPKRDAAMGGILGLLLGLGIAFLREQLDERLRTREQAETATGLPVLAELPFDEESAREPETVASQLRPSGALAEAIRGLRTSLTFLGVDEPLRRVVVTSSVPNEGKSLVAANLAIAYAQAGLRTILVAADLRRSRAHTMFSVPADAMGLSEVIAGLAEFLTRTSSNGHSRSGTGLDEVLTGVLRPTSVFGLFLLPAGKVPPNPAELLGSQRAGEVFDALLTRADVIVIDTPPVLAVTDAAVLAPRADGVVVVASAGETHKGALARSAATLTATRARVLGLVFNKVDRAGSGYGYGYYGRYYRGYYGQAEHQSRSWFPWNRAGRSTSEVEAAQ
jgi:non-specific protein-tyrosine kinase